MYLSTLIHCTRNQTRTLIDACACGSELKSRPPSSERCFPQKKCLDTSTLSMYFLREKINISRGDFSNISAKTATLPPSTWRWSYGRSIGKYATQFFNREQHTRDVCILVTERIHLIIDMYFHDLTVNNNNNHNSVKFMQLGTGRMTSEAFAAKISVRSNRKTCVYYQKTC